MTRNILLASVCLLVAAPLRAQRPQEPPVDTAAARWMRDTVTRDLVGRRDLTVGVPRFRGDTAWLTASRTETTPPDRIYVFSIEYRFERRAAAWILTPTRTLSHAHGKRVP